MFDFFAKVIGYIEMAFEFLVNVVESLFTFIAIIPQAMSLPLHLVGYLPTIVGTAVVSVLAIGVIKLLAGR